MGKNILSKEIETIPKNHMKILNWKNTITKIKNSLRSSMAELEELLHLKIEQLKLSHIEIYKEKNN